MNSWKHYLAVFTQINNKAERFRFVLIQCFVFSLPFDRYYSSAILILLSILTVFDLNTQKLKSIPKQFYIFQMVYLLSALGYFLSYHHSKAGFVLEKQLALLIFPIVLPLAIHVDEKKNKCNAYYALHQLFCGH